MVHGDDMGLRLPPLMAPVQLVVVPITRKNADVEAILDAAKLLVEAATEAGIRAKLDGDDTKSPGYRFSYWEQKACSSCSSQSLEFLRSCLLSKLYNYQGRGDDGQKPLTFITAASALEAEGLYLCTKMLC